MVACIHHPHPTKFQWGRLDVDFESCVCVCVSQDPIQFMCGGNPYLVFIRVELVLTSSQGW